jgi:hypothetical protein
MRGIRGDQVFPLTLLLSIFSVISYFSVFSVSVFRRMLFYFSSSEAFN